MNSEKAQVLKAQIGRVSGVPGSSPAFSRILNVHRKERVFSGYKDQGRLSWMR